MPKKLHWLRGRRTMLAWVLAAMLPFVLANTCFKTSTAPDYVPTEEDSSDADTTSSLLAEAPVLPGNDW